ncbi:Rubredoxin family protein [Theileria parva strain Muguga]|uniref:Rubredoxin-like domain-containing protein n=1 Tax=Theileria parva TaxID=5875 RepID=Q4MZI9_THEPA|nr:Rubredoxin family protein [Theileria parva strain Muguga]EAN31272.1 Rubredoxin family protein [Theileria parva strain Muguga]|eukprot:XP_763555.1 hypothetical protein [Theileria parva strain Muguga]
MRLLSLFIFILYLKVSEAFRLNSNKHQTNTTHSSCRNKVDSSLFLFGSSEKSLSKCPVLNSLSSKVSYLNQKVNSLVPGGWVTTLSLPLGFLAYKYLWKKKSGLDKGSTLHRYQCTSCGYVIFPARNREEKFFSESFTCPNCGSPRSKFTEKFR